MILHLHIHYRTQLGSQLAIVYSSDREKSGIEKQLLFQTYDGENWTAILELKKGEKIKYKYVIVEQTKTVLTEWGATRSFTVPASGKNVFIQDKWRPRSDERNAFFSSAFTEAVFRRVKSPTNIKKPESNKSNTIIFRLHEANINPDRKFCILGNIPELGLWDIPLVMDDSQYPYWEASVEISSSNIHLEYKYAICDHDGKNLISWEDGDNRICHFVVPEASNNLLVLVDEHYRNPSGYWRGTGVAIPVFSLRTSSGMGIGEFSDIIPLVDWASKTGMNIVQVLPVNDTIATKTWVDSYPYAAISVFALHPLYINIQKIAPFNNTKDAETFKNILSELNQSEQIDFERVLDAKFVFLRKLYEQEKTKFLRDKETGLFIEKNKDWLQPYAVFCFLRDQYGTCNFTEWPEHSIYTPELIETMCNPSHENYEQIAFWYFIQFHADRQLIEAKNYARKHRVALKGDLPIGIYRYSCDAWVAPHLYNMNEQAGAPPDDYAELGQNWGFPTYNWQEMAKDGFVWWRGRMQKLNEYFDALRIDHILGFFRIWQIPADQIAGTMGLFNPRLPYSADELAGFGISGDLSRYVDPYITEQILHKMFSKDLSGIKKVFFDDAGNGLYHFKSGFRTQTDITAYLSKNPKYAKFEKNLQHLMTEVLLLEEPGSGGKYFNPRITLITTESFTQLDHFSQTRFTNLYNEYYFKRHDEFWKGQALWKLPALLDASNMLICGEDLGMIPASVPGVMKELNIISLEIQRMPKGNSRFGRVSHYPYFSVCSPSCHDMSTIRGWWEADHEMAKEFYYNYLKWYGLTPMECTPEIVQSIVEDHLASPSIFAIFPVQDLVGMDINLRRKDAQIRTDQRTQ
jgi:4-alpha-glucanotransferase